MAVDELIKGNAASGGTDIYGLVKIGERVHIERLFRSGEVFFQTLGYFRKLEKEQERGDLSEGVSHFMAQSSIKSLTVDGKLNLPIVSPIRIRAKRFDDINVFCMYALKKPGPPELDGRCRAFGDACLVIRDAADFLRRVKRAFDVCPELADDDFEVKYGLVEYVPEQTYVGEMGPQKKFDRFAHQSEFRFYVDPGLGKSLTLTIGSLEDIAERGLLGGA